MGKKKSFYKKQLRPFVKSNSVLLAALSGAAAGIAIVGMLGTEKAREVLHSVKDRVRDFGNKAEENAQGKSMLATEAK